MMPSGRRAGRLTRGAIKLEEEKDNIGLHKARIDELRGLHQGDKILVRVDEYHSWGSCTLLRDPCVESDETDEKVAVLRLHVLPPNAPRARKNANIPDGFSFLTSSKIRFAVPKFNAPVQVSDLPTTNVHGNSVRFGVIQGNNKVSEAHSNIQFVDTQGTSVEERTAQDRCQPLLMEFMKSGSASCDLEFLNPMLSEMMDRVVPKQRQKVFVFAPTEDYLGDIVVEFTGNVPGEYMGIDVVGLVKPFFSSDHWRVTAIVVATSMPSKSSDFDDVSAAAILISNREGVVLVPFTATNRSRRLEGLAHFFSSLFIVARNYFGGSTTTPVITHVVVKKGKCDFTLFGERRNASVVKGGDFELGLGTTLN
ncbi:hypothetical protein THAOC_21185 [Thalassiosira oceanica]|uniref:Uncharacterized protein n=1 Tax=Thalassiosira oceanica TaxID=159749 RepID=K0SCN1_THAOC|nr:hypothetical protein THAOC_21185 [Thalassiosira oceanica]|eukprot:EJK58671.1 hypothetical protein THAOC_21185 [Thalassiosira oceanica]